MDKGKVDEYDIVPNLLQNKNGSFYKLVKESGMDIETILKTYREKKPYKELISKERSGSSPKRDRKSPKLSKNDKSQTSTNSQKSQMDPSQKISKSHKSQKSQTDQPQAQPQFSAKDSKINR